MPQLYRNRQPRYRAQRRRALKSSGITPRNRQQVWGVKLDRETPAILEPYIIRGLAVAGYLWLKVRGAKLALRMGWGSNVIKAEFKRCLLCHRPLIANAAEKYRKALESSTKPLPCGPRCEVERLSRLWDRLTA